MAPSRRGFVVGCGAIAASAAFCGRSGNGEPALFTRPLPIPPLIDAAASRHSVKLIASAGEHAFVEGKPTRTYGYSAPLLGPAIHVRRGDEVEMVVENHLDAATTVHWHGLLVPGESDGGPQQLIQPGARWRPILKIDQPAATLWFHPHPHGDTARQIYMGLTGMIIVDDGSDSGLGLPRTFGVDDLPLILQDRSFDSGGSIEYENKSLGPLDIAYGARGDVVIVNGVVAPLARVPANFVRLRFLNAANAQNFELRFSDQRTFYVIASDGGFLSAPAAVKQLTIAPAERFEVLVDFADGNSVVLETGPDEQMGVFGRLAPDGSADYVAVVRTTSTPLALKQLPLHLIDLPPLNASSAVRRRRLVLNSGLCASRAEPRAHADLAGDMPGVIGINGKPFDMRRIDIKTKLGTAEVWEITSVGMAHPFHVHGALFRVLSIEGDQPPPHLAGWKDTLLVEDKAEILVAFNQPATRAHPFMYHCHILEHEDAGLMGQCICT
jgi:FtsP/CotA-like multicopper oxidase with cupredoxin domain